MPLILLPEEIEMDDNLYKIDDDQNIKILSKTVALMQQLNKKAAAPF